MLDPTSSTACWSLWLVIAVFTVVPVRTGDKVCSIGRHGSLTRFNGETLTVALPCKYRMADFTCAQHRVRVTPGSSVDESGGFNPDTVWLKVFDLNSGEEGAFRTSLKRLAKYHNGEVRSPWKSTDGFLSGADDAVSYNRSTRAVTFSPVDQLSVVMLTDPPSVMLTCKGDNFSSRPTPETLCGDGTTSDTMERAALRVLGNDSDLTMQQFIHYTVMNDVTVTQSDTCRAPASQFQTCSSQEDAARTCHVIFDDPSRATCLMQSGTALHHYYTHCLQAVCDGDASAIVAMETYVRDNCSGPIDAICISENFINNTELDYRIIPDKVLSRGHIKSMFLLDGGRMLIMYFDELRLIDWQDQANTTLSSVQLPERPQTLAQLPNQKFLVSLYDDTKLWLVNISGDVLQVERELNTEKIYVALCPGPNNTFWASVWSEADHKGRVDQLDLQGRVLRTVFTDTTDQFPAIYRIKRYGDNLYLFTFDGQPGILSLTTGEVTTTIGQTDLATLDPMYVYDLDYDSKGDAYLCVESALCGEAVGCVVRIDGCGQVTVLPSFFSRPSQQRFCLDLIPTANKLLINWIYIDQSGSDKSEITVQSLPL